MAQNKTNEKKNNGGHLGFEETLWQAADKMRGHMDSSEYKHVVLGLIFLKYISDAFDECRRQLEELMFYPTLMWRCPSEEAIWLLIERVSEQ